MSLLRTFLLVVLVTLFTGSVASCANEAPSSPAASSTSSTALPPQGKSVRQGETSLPALKTTTAEGTLQQATTGLNTTGPEVLLRVEGSPGARFSGVCNAGGNRSVLSGKVPERFTFGPGVSCRIQNQSRKGGKLRVVLLANGKTRSVQQTSTPGGTIQVSYGG